MKFSTKAEYGLRAMTSLAFDFPEKKSIGDIAKLENISIKYLERLMNELRKSELIKSYKGKKGGYVLSRNPKKIKVGEIVEALEGLISPMDCESKKCKSKQCFSRVVWVELGRQIRKTLYSIKLSDLIK